MKKRTDPSLLSLGFVFLAAMVVTPMVTTPAHAGLFDRKTDAPAQAAQPSAPPPPAAIAPPPPPPPAPPLPPGILPSTSSTIDLKDQSATWTLISSPTLMQMRQCSVTRAVTQNGIGAPPNSPNAPPQIVFTLVHIGQPGVAPTPDKLQLSINSFAAPEKGQAGALFDEKESSLQAVARNYNRSVLSETADVKAFIDGARKSKKVTLMLDEVKVDLPGSAVALIGEKLVDCMKDQEKVVKDALAKQEQADKAAQQKK